MINFLKEQIKPFFSSWARRFFCYFISHLSTEETRCWNLIFPCYSGNSISCSWQDIFVVESHHQEMTGTLMSEESHLQHPILASIRRLTQNVFNNCRQTPKGKFKWGLCNNTKPLRKDLISRKEQIFLLKSFIPVSYQLWLVLALQPKKITSGYWKRITTLLSASEEYGSDPTDRRELPHWFPPQF